jgi:hypothetical protein
MMRPAPDAPRLADRGGGLVYSRLPSFGTLDSGVPLEALS